MLKKISFLAFVFFFYANAFAQITPIPINYIDDLAKIGNNANYPMNGYYILQRDLDFNDTNAYSSPTQIPNFNGNWTGIASTATVIGNPFSGTFDGNYHIIKNWRSITLDSYKGFFRYAIGATIKNLGLVNIKILNANSGGCGGLLSSGSDLNINNCFVTGTIDAYNSGSTDFGGLVGIATISRITNCFTNVDIKSWDRYAGLVGYLNASSTAPNIIKNCYTAGKLQLQNAKSYGFLIGLRNVNTASKDSIINNYSVGKFVGTIPSNTYGGLLIGATYNQIATIRDTLFVKGCYSIENSINPIKFNFLSGNINYNTTTLNVTYMYDTVFKASSTKTFTPITTAAYSSTYLYNAANQQYPVLYRSDSNILLGGQRAVYPAVVEKNTGTITGIADSVKPVDNFTKNGNTVYTINNVNRISSGGVFAYFSINRSNGTLSWGETIPTGEYLVEVRGVNGTENSQSWIRISITRSSNALVAVNSQSVQFTTKDSTRNGDYIVIDTLNLINRNFTIETWAKMDVRAAAWKRIFDFGTGANGNGVLLGFPTSTQFGFHCNGVDKVVAFPAGFNPLAWNHYAITQENDIVKLYINGDFVTSGPGAKPSVGFNKNYIGRSNYNNDSCTAGKFSDFRIWLNAHSAEQIAALYNKKIPTNADSLYVFLPLTSNYFRELPILSNPIGNSSSNIYGQVPNPYFNRVSNTSVKNIYDSNQQYVFGTLNTLLQDNETIEIAVKDSNTWNPVSNVSGYLFSYKLPTNFISGNIYVRSKIGAGATKTTRFGNYYASSTYYVDWIGTGVTFNPNIPIKIYPKYAYNGLRYIIQRNKNKLADTFFNPLIGTFTDANQKMILNINQGFVRNDYRGTININNTFFPNAIFYNSYNNTDTLLKSQNTDTPINYIKVAYNKGNSMYIFKNNTPTGIYYPNNGISITNSLGQKNVFYDGASSILDLKNMYVYYGDSLKAVKYNPVRYVLNAFKTSSSNIPTALGNDSMLNDLRFYMQVRRNGVDITNYYSINRNNMVVTGSNRPVGTDSIFLRFIGIFDEEVLDTLLFNYTLYKPSFKYTPNASSAFNLGNKTAIFYPQVLDSGGKTLTFRLINTNTNYTVEAQTGTLKLINWDNAGNDTLRIEASNGMYKDTATFIYTKTAIQHKVLFYSNSSYRTYSTTGQDYIQLPGIDLRNKAFGMDVWYKHNALIGGNHRIIDIGTGPNNQGILLMFPDSNRLFVRTPNQSDSPINIPAGVRIRNWNHYAISVSNTGVCSFYMNGRLIFSRAGGGRTPQTIFSLNYLGKSNYGAPDAPSEGQFTDFRIWDNAIDSTVYNTRGVPYFSTNTGANLIFYLPLSEPVYNSNITLPENYRLINKSIVTSTALLDSVAYIKGSSNSYNFDSNRIFVAGQSPLANAAKTVTVITNNYASVADTTIKNATSTMSNNIKNYYWSVDLPSSQGAYLNNQILSISDYVSAISNFSYKYLIKYLPNYTTYLPGDSVQVFTSKAGFKLPRNDFWVANQKPTKYKWIDSGGLNNVINMQLDTVTGRFSWLALTEPVESVYPIKVSVTNEVGTIIFNGQVLLSDSLQSIQYPIDSLSVNFGKDSSSVPYTEGITASTRFNITAVPNNGAITINTLNGRLYWTTNVPPGLYTLKIQASNYINTVSKTIKLNIKTVSPTGLTYQTKNYAFINTGFDTSTTYINAPVVNTGGSAVKYMANTPTGCRIDSNTGAINCKKNLVPAGNYRVIVNAQNVAGFVKDTLYINVSTTSKDSIIGYKNAYYTLNTDATNIGGDYIGLPNTDLPNNFSIEAWVKLTDITRNYQQIFDAGNAANNHVISIGTFSNTGRLFITIPTAASGNASVDIPDTATVPRIANNTWFHVAYIKRGTNVSLYLNGTKVIDNNTAAVSYNTTITQVYFGASNFANQSMLGQLDECRIWRRALSEFEINRYKNVFLSPQDDSLYVYLPLHGFLIKDTNIAEGTVIKNRATGALALTDPITVYGNGMKMSRDSNRQIVYGTHDSLTTTTKIITVKVNYFRQPPANFVNTTAVKQGNYWTTLNNNIPTNLLLGTLTVSKSASEIFKPNPFNVYYPPTKLTYNNLNTYKLGQTTTLYTTNKPTIATNYDSANMTITMSPVYAGISINGTTGIITINTDTVYKLYGKQVKTRVTAETGLGKTSTELTFNIVNTNIIGYNNTSVCLPNNNGADYIHLPNIDLSNVNFAVETWFKLIGSPINNKRIFDFAPGTSGSARSGLLMWFAGNKLYLGAFNQDQLINFGDADTVLKNGLNEWNKYSLFYNASTKTYYAYINGVLKGTATVATDKYVAPLISNFLANNSYGDAITDGYYREFKIYKNLSYTDFISNLPYNIVPNISDKSLYYYLPLSININNKSFIGNATISNNTELENRALMYNPNALNNNAILVTANEEAFYYGDSNNQIITGEFADQASRIRFRYTNGQIKDTILPVLASQNFSWQIRGNNISGKFKVFNSISAQNADSINILLAPSKLKYASNNRVYSIVAGNSGTPTYIGTDTVLFSIDSGNVAGITIHATTGLISWSNAIPAGLTKIRVLASNAGGTTNITYIANFQDTLKGFSYTPDSIQASGNNADSLPFLPSFTKGTGAAFTILNPIEGFSIDENNGKIYWTNTVANGVYKIRVEANNIYNTPLIDTITIKLTNLPPSNIQYVKDTMVFSQGVHLKTVIPSVNTGGLPTIFAINNITPNGGNFSIDSLTGEIKWVPTTVGTYTIIVVATNSLGSVTKTIQITITSAGNIAVDYNNAALTLGIKILGNNSKNRVELPNIDLRGAGGYTIETWARIIDANNVGLWRRIFDVGTGQNYEGVILGFPTSTAFGLHASTVEDYTFDFPPNFSALNWNHYAVTVRDSVRLYINGVLIGTQRSNNPTVIFNKNYLNYSNWVIDEPSYNVYQETRVWKYARSGDEIAQNYQGSVPDEAIGLYYYLPFKQAGYLPGSIINPTNFVLDPTLPLFIGNPSYTSKIANAAVKSSITDSSKIVAVIPNYLVATVLNTNQVSDLIPYYKIDSTRQKIQGNFADTLLAGEQLQYSIDTGRIWKNIGFVKNNNFSQTLDTSFKYGLIKIRSVINNVATSRVFNDIDVLVFPNPPTGARATARNDGTVTLQFTPPLIKSAITGYKIYTSAGVLLATATQSPVIITGLNNGQTYQFGVTTINSRGESKLSTLSSPITVVNNILQVTTYTNTIAGVSITPTTNVTAYTNFRVTYQVNAGYKLDSIIINNVKNVDSTTGYTFVNINTINSVKVYASKIPFRITITQNSGGVVTPNLSTITTYYGDTLTIQISPNNRYRVDSVFINGAYREDAKNGFTFYNIQENNTVRVVFKEIIYNKITIEIVGKGKTTVTGGMVEVEQGTSYRVEYRADEGNYLVSVFVDEVLTNDSVSGYTINAITSDVKIRLVFKIQTFTITTSVLNGEIQPTGESTYNYGSSLTVRFSPKDETYVLDSLIVDGELQYNPEIDSFTFTDIKANHTIRAIFNLKSEVRFTIVIRSNTGGVVSPSVNQLVSYGGSLRVSWVINPGYVLDSLLIGGKNNTDSVNGYTFTDVRGQQSIYIKFKLRTFTIISSAGLHGSINPLGISIVNYGASKTFILLPNAGYETDSLYINGSIVSKPADNIYTFNNVLTNKTIYVTFKVVTINPTPCTGTKQTPNIVRVTDALKSDITTFATQRWYLAGTIKDSTTNNTYTPTDAGVYTLLGVDATGCESNISKKYYYSKSCIIPTGRLGNGANIQTDIVGNANIMVIKWCTDLIQGEVRVQVLDISGEQIEDKKIPASFGTYILNKQQIQSKKFIIKVIDNNGEIIQISDVVNN